MSLFQRGGFTAVGGLKHPLQRHYYIFLETGSSSHSKVLA